MSATVNTYDQVPYLSIAYPQTHPDRIATTAQVFGLRPPNVETARILEIGCASGANLIPMAVELPQASLVGIDLSVRQVVEGQDLIRQCGLGNVKIHHRSIMEVGADLGVFDYIICHNIFTGVTPEVQEKILDICKKNLAPDGIAYISYNTLPGSAVRSSLRDMMLFHARSFPNPSGQLQQMRDAVDLFSKSIDKENNPHGQLLLAELELLRRTNDSYLFHEHLAPHSTPLYFFEFNRRAEAHGLRFLAEADMRSPSPQTPLPKEAQEILQRLAPNAIYLEQYVDFIRNRAFRQTLLCHADREPIYRLRPDALANVYIAAAVHPKNANINLQSDEPEQFQGERGVGVTVREPIVKAALAILGEEWPRRSSFHVLRARARARFEPRPAQDSGSLGRDAQVLGLSLLQFFTSVGSGLVELSLRPIPVATAPGDLPLVTSLNRYLAASGRPVVNLRHETVILGEFERQLIQRLDGTQNRNQLRESFRKLIRDKVLNVQKDGVTVTDDGQLGVLLDETINQQLGRFVRQSLLVEQSPPRAVQEKSSATVDESAKANVQ